jgi:heme/copper-type cytochrome/quinol oxidase subunit 3
VGAVGGEVIEGFVLILEFLRGSICGQILRRGLRSTPAAILGIPTINLVLMLLSILPAWWAWRAAKAHDRTTALIALTIHFFIGTAIVVLRYYECFALNVRWDTNAYGSISWALLFAHGYTTLTDIFDTGGLVLPAYYSSRRKNITSTSLRTRSSGTSSF